ncbi:VMAP-C domain-containing protein [Actinomadura sp. 3N407]|uniref:VMAP-C domain-containing protein n=1 Tax=Actinomadura sp. 3N407 TaxID=3457423 RepID=UPI003FCDE08D
MTRRHRTVNGSLDLADQERLVRAFMRIDGMRRRRTRDLYVTLLEDELGRHLPFDRHEEELHDVWSLVRACLTTTGAVHALAGVLERIHRGSTPMAGLNAVVAELVPEPLLTPAESRDLHRLVGALERDGTASPYASVLPSLYRRAVGPVGPVPDHDVRSLREAVAHLEQVLQGADGVPPLLVLVHGLAEHAEGDTAAAIRDWARRFAARSGVDPTRLAGPGRPALPGGPAPDGRARAGTYLTVECRHDGAGTDRLMVTAWLQKGTDPGITLRSDDEPLPRALLPVLLGELLADDPEVVNRDDPDLVIEFVLPRGLFGFAFDRLAITVDGLERRLGVDYPVVLRSLDRLRRGALHHHWRRKWSRLREASQDGEVCWVGTPREFDNQWLYARLLQPSAAVLALAFPPWGDTPEPVDELWVGLQAGTPVIAWCRREEPSDHLVKQVTALLATDPMTLPYRLLDLRRQAALNGSGEHPGLDLALLFDDADRIPEPYQRLRPPT